jgi:hypothetical protein
VAEWLRNGLQNRVPRFNSGRGLQQLRGARAVCNCVRRADFTLCKRGALCYRRDGRSPWPLLPGSSAVEQPAVNRLVDGSNPSRGAKQHPEVCIKVAIMRECPAALNVEGFDAQKSCRRIVGNNDGNARSRQGANHNRPDHRRRSAEFLHFRWKRIFCRLDNLQLDAWSRSSIDVPRKGHQGHASYSACDNLFGGNLGEHRRRKVRAEMMKHLQRHRTTWGRQCYEYSQRSLPLFFARP